MSEEDKVVERPSPSKLPGRKSAQIPLEIGEGERVFRDLRIEAASGLFHIEHAGKLYSSRSKRSLEAHVIQAIRAQKNVIWTRYILLTYEAYDGTDFGGKRRYDLSAKREPDHVSSITCDFEIYDYSNELTYLDARHGAWRRKRRRVRSTSPADPNAALSADPEWADWPQAGQDDDPRYDATEWVHATSFSGELPRTAIPHTLARQRALEAISAAMRQLDMNLRRLFAGDGLALAERLDAFDASRLLTTSTADERQVTDVEKALSI